MMETAIMSRMPLGERVGCMEGAEIIFIYVFVVFWNVGFEIWDSVGLGNCLDG